MTSAPRVEFMRYSFTAHTCKVHTQYFHWESTVHELSSLFVQSEENSLKPETTGYSGAICKNQFHICCVTGPTGRPVFIRR